MARRRKLYDVAAALLDAFLSRNNDLNGYWAVGQLRSFADAQGIDEVRLDLLRGDTPAHPDVASCVTANFRAVLERHWSIRDLPRDWLRSAEVVLVFGAFESSREPLYLTLGDPLICAVSLVDERGRTYRCRRSARCLPHNPRREQRRNIGLPEEVL